MKFDDDQYRHQCQANVNQIVANGQHRLLEMGLCLGLLHQAGSLAKAGVGAGGGHFGHHLTLLDHGAGEGLVAGALGDRQGLARQRRLVDAEVIPLDQFHIGGNDIAEADADDVTWHQLLGIDFPPLAVA